MVKWPTPKSLKALRGVFRPHRILQEICIAYRVISRTFTNLLKKNAFRWDPQAEEAFQQLKVAMTLLLSLYWLILL